MAFVDLGISVRKRERRNASTHTTTCALPDALKAAAAALAKRPPAERYAKLAEMGVAYEPCSLEMKYRTKENRVPGCTSVVYIHAVVRGDGKLDVQGSSDAKITAGLISLLCAGLSGGEASSALDFSFVEFATASALDSFLSPSRANAFSNVLRTIQEQIRGRTSPPPLPLKLNARDYVSGVQAEDVAVLLSGGVDSSVSLRLLLEQGYRPKPYYLKIWLEDELAHLGECPWEEDLRYAKAVCDQVDLEVEPVPFQREYWERVVEYTVQEAKVGRTPNPDVMCNTRVKFGAFLERIGNDFGKVASGHYASTGLNAENGLTELLCSGDDFKDQTYFLAHLNQAQVAKAMFPIGMYTKGRVRELATEFDLPNKARRDSQGICFLGRLRFDDFLEHHLGKQLGPLVDYDTGLVLGQHRGYWFYTLGQRKGLGLSGGPWYVVSKNPDENVVYLSTRYNDNDKPRNSFYVEHLSWISGASLKPEQASQLRVKIRHGPRTHTCSLVLDPSNPHSGNVVLSGQERQALAPGQFAVFYHGDICLGSGIIAADPGLAFAPVQRTDKLPKRLQAHYLP